MFTEAGIKRWERRPPGWAESWKEASFSLALPQGPRLRTNVLLFVGVIWRGQREATGSSPQQEHHPEAEWLLLNTVHVSQLILLGLCVLHCVGDAQGDKALTWRCGQEWGRRQRKEAPWARR